MEEEFVRIKKLISKKLLSKKEIEELVEYEETLTKLIEQGFIDDERYLSAFIHDEAIIKLNGPKSIKIKLLNKSFLEEKIDTELDKIDFNLILKRNVYKYKNKRNIVIILQRKGFDIEDIKKEISN